jgi:hypothetical protein
MHGGAAPRGSKNTGVPGARTQGQFQSMAFCALARYIGVFSLPANAGAPRRGDQHDRPMMLTSADSLAAETGRGGGKPAQAGEAGVNWTVSFVLPGSRFFAGGEAPPRPTDPRVRVSKLPPATKVVLTYSWFIFKQRNEEMAAGLLAASRSGRSSATTRP